MVVMIISKMERDGEDDKIEEKITTNLTIIFFHFL